MLKVISSKWFWLPIVVLLALLIAMTPRPVSADHGVTVCGNGSIKACLSRSSPFVEQYVKLKKEVTFCFNQAAYDYPDFARQTRITMQYIAEDLGVPAREVAMPASSTDMSCVYRHVMRYDHPCGNCGAWIWTQNLPVLTEYNGQAGYTVWLSTNIHEAGHGYCLLDEHYDQVNFRSWVLYHIHRINGVLQGDSWRHGAPTTMDIGTWLLAEYGPNGIVRFTQYDLERCSETLGRDVTASPPSDPCADGAYDATWRATWKPCEGSFGGMWVSVSGWKWEPSTDRWFYLQFWMWENCNQYGHRGSPTDGLYGLPGQTYYSVRAGTFATTPGC